MLIHATRAVQIYLVTRCQKHGIGVAWKRIRPDLFARFRLQRLELGIIGKLIEYQDTLAGRKDAQGSNILSALIWLAPEYVAVLSSPPEAMRLPSGDQATLCTLPE
jgi:hypothetical protein